MLQKLLKGAEEDIAGNYFKPVRANKLIAQAHETQRAVSKWKGTISYRHTCHVKGSTSFHGNFHNMQRWRLLLAPFFQINKTSLWIHLTFGCFFAKHSPTGVWFAKILETACQRRRSAICKLWKLVDTFIALVTKSCHNASVVWPALLHSRQEGEREVDVGKAKISSIVSTHRQGCPG